MPGILGGIFSAIFIASFTNSDLNYIGSTFVTIKANRSNLVQGAYQISCLFSSIGFGIAFGIIGGVILRRLAIYTD
jgi:hypothetical protein